MDLICVNSKFSQEQLNFYQHHGVITPTKDKIYSVRKKVWNRGKLGIYLNELVNPEIPIQSIISPNGVKLIEPNWDINRFRTLTGETVTEEMLETINQEA